MWQLTWLADVCLANLLRTSSENSDSLFSPKTVPIWELTSPVQEEGPGEEGAEEEGAEEEGVQQYVPRYATMEEYAVGVKKAKRSQTIDIHTVSSC